MTHHVTGRVQNQSNRRLVARHNSAKRQGGVGLYKASKKKRENGAQGLNGTETDGSEQEREQGINSNPKREEIDSP